MTKQELITSLRSSIGGADFISLSELARYLGAKDPYKVKRKYLLSLNRIGKKYFIKDVAAELIKHMN